MQVAEPIETSFVAFKLTVEELIYARNLNPVQRQYFQTLLADAAEEKLAIEYDAKDPFRFAQREAYLRGQMDILNMLLSQDAIARPKRYKEEAPTNDATQSKPT
jgi:hypothetical protein